jgi:phenylacetate-CoA ligase
MREFDTIGFTPNQRDQFALNGLREVVQRALTHNDFYRQSLGAAGLKQARELTDLAAFSKLPLLGKEQLRDLYPFGLLSVPQDRVRRLHASSGTTGKPTISGYTEKDLSDWSFLMARALHHFGLRAGDVVLNTHGYGLFTGGLGVHAGAEALGCAVIPSSSGHTLRQLQLIQDLGVTAIIGTPSYILTLADEMERLRVDRRGLKLRVCGCGAEPWSESLRQEIETRLQVKAFDIYGLSEVLGPGVGSEAADRQGELVIWEDFFYPEFIDGELVITTLTKEAMPLIRYRTGDLSNFTGRDFRGCRTIDRIKGRADDMLKIKGVKLFPSQIEFLILQSPELTGHFVLELHPKGRMEDLLIKVEHRPGVDSEALRRAGDELRQRAKSLIGVGLKVEIVAPNSLPRGEGKTNRVFRR